MISSPLAAIVARGCGQVTSLCVAYCRVRILDGTGWRTFCRSDQ